MLCETIKRVSIPNDKLVLINGLSFTNANLTWEMTHIPRNRNGGGNTP